MPTYYVKKREAGVSPEPGENWLVWFSGSGIEGCNNVLLLYGEGDVLLLKTARRVGRDELDALDFENWTHEDYKKWEEIFGTGAASNELLTEYRQFKKLNG